MEAASVAPHPCIRSHFYWSVSWYPPVVESETLKRFVSGLSRALWGIALGIVVIETAFGSRLGLFPNRVFYPALLIALIGAWPIAAELIRARRDGRRALSERNRQLAMAVDSPALAADLDERPPNTQSL